MEHLKKVLRFFIEDYNYRKPHGSLNGLTPDEAWMGLTPDIEFRTKLLAKAKQHRLTENRTNLCHKCV